MRFQRGIPRRPRGRARKRYTMSDAALRQRCCNLKRTRIRSAPESRIIKLRVWQSRFESGLPPSERALARELRVSQPYIHKLLRKAQSEGMDALTRHGKPVTLDELAEARRVTAKLRDAEPGLLAPEPQPRALDELHALATNESITQTWREVVEWKRENPCDGRLRTIQEWQELGRRGRVQFSVPVPH